MRKVKPSLTSPRHQKSIPPLASFNSRLRTHPFRLLPLSPDATSSIFHEVDAATWYTVSTRDFGKLGAGLGESAVSWQFGRHLLDKYPVSCRVSVGTLLRTYTVVLNALHNKHVLTYVRLYIYLITKPFLHQRTLCLVNCLLHCLLSAVFSKQLSMIMYPIFTCIPNVKSSPLKYVLPYICMYVCGSLTTLHVHCLLCFQNNENAADPIIAGILIVVFEKISYYFVRVQYRMQVRLLMMGCPVNLDTVEWTQYSYHQLDLKYRSVCVCVCVCVCTYVHTYEYLRTYVCILHCLLI